MMHAIFLDDWRGLMAARVLRVRRSRRLRVPFLVLAVLLGGTSVLHAATATWNPNPEPDIAGYILSYGTSPGVHPTSVDVKDVTTWQVTALTQGQTYYFVLQAYNTSALTSANSVEVVFTVPTGGTPTLISLSPASGPVAMPVTISGTNFGSTQGTSIVRFNGTTATPSSWNMGSIVVPVPGAGTTGTIVVTVGGVASNGITFTVYRAPTLTQPANRTSARNATVSLQLLASDPDGDALTYSATGLPAPLTLNAATGLISGTLGSPSVGTHTVTATASDGTLSASQTFSWTVKNVAPALSSVDFDGDGKTDITVFRPSSGTWEILKSGSNYTTSVALAWGLGTDRPVPGDYDGDRKTDVAVYRPSNGTWYILLSSTNYTTSIAFAWGISTDIPVQGDYDGDGKTDVAVYRPSTGTWFILQSSSNDTTSVAFAWGISTDVPMPGDYDGDGKADLAIYRPSTGTWYILQSSSNNTTNLAMAWGSSTDLPVPGDYDGDGKSDVAVYRPSSATWYILKSSTNFTLWNAYQWGSANGDVPVSGDYDGDGSTDVAVYRPSTATWYILNSGTNFTTSNVYQWGAASSDVPVPGRP